MTNGIIYDNLQERMICIFDLVFYVKGSGRIPVREFLLSLEPKLRAKAFRDIELLKNLGNDLKEPYVKPIKGSRYKGLYELRIRFAHDIARIFYFTYCNNQYVLLNGFIKKTLKTPQNEIEKARDYMEDYKRRNDYE